MAILATEKILTLDYWKPASKLEVGDYVFDRNGSIVKVKLVQQYMGQDCHEVTFSDHLTLSGDSHLSFPTENLKYRNRAYNYKGRHQFRRPLKPLAVDALRTTPLRDHRNRAVYSVQTAKPLQLPYQDLPVPPFVFGMWFFSHNDNGTFKIPPGMEEFVTEKFKDCGYQVTRPRKIRRQYASSPKIASQLIPNIPRTIPNNYLLASPEQRLELLSGIMCARSRQYNPTQDRFRFTSKQFDPVLRVQMLAESLGCQTKVQHDEYLQNYTVFFKCKHQIYPNQSSPPVKIYHSRRYITKISTIPSQMCVHIETDGEDNTILAGEGFISCL